jgi:hypothetical protein
MDRECAELAPEPIAAVQLEVAFRSNSGGSYRKPLPAFHVAHVAQGTGGPPGDGEKRRLNPDKA